MSALGRKLRLAEGNRVMFWCPGCDSAHVVNVGPGGWIFNQNGDVPTFSPSVLVRSGHYIPERAGKECWCTFNEKNPDNPSRFKCECCHSFVTDGRIQFLGDCTHALANQTVDLPDFPVRNHYG